MPDQVVAHVHVDLEIVQVDQLDRAVARRGLHEPGALIRSGEFFAVEEAGHKRVYGDTLAPDLGQPVLPPFALRRAVQEQAIAGVQISSRGAVRRSWEPDAEYIEK